MSENYKGTIELISGLKQKNNLDFPLMEASAVAFYEEVQAEDGSTTVKEIRLPEKLKSVGISKEEKEQLIQEAVSQAQNVLEEDLTSLGDRVGEAESDVYELNEQVAKLTEQIEKGDNPNLRVYYEKSESTLYLYDDPEDKNGLIKPNPDTGDMGNVISTTIIEGGGGGTKLPYKLTLKKLTDLQTALLGRKVVVKAIANMLQIPSDSEEGEPFPISKELTFRLTSKSESKGTLTTTFKQDTNKEFEVDLTPFVGLGKNEVTLFVSYSEEVVSEEGEIKVQSVQSSQSWNFKMIELTLTSSFNDNTEFINRNASWTGTAIGDAVKTIHYELNGEPWKTSTHAELTANLSMTIPFQGHKVCPLTIYATTVVEGENGPETITSDKLHYELLFVESENPTPILRLKVTPSPMKQYSPGVIDYTVYSNQNIVKAVELSEGENIIFNGNISNAAQQQPYTFMDFGDKTIALKYGDFTKEINVTVEEAEYQIEPITTGLILDLLPTGRSNNASDYNVFYNNALKVVDPEAAATIPEITWDFSENFDWNNGGWQTDENQNTYFCVKAGTQVAINYDMFKDNSIISSGNAAGSGKEFKLIFKTTNVSQPDATFLKCLEDEVGLQMNVHEAYISSNENKLYSPYSENDIIEFDFNIFPGVREGTSLKPFDNIIPMTMTYEDGTPFQPLIHNESVSYEHKTAQPIIIGSPNCDIHIYRMKIYGRYLTDKEVLSNFIADARNGEDMVNRHLRNQIYEAGRLTPNSLAKARPDLKILKITCPVFTNSKSDFKPMTSVEMIHKNGDPIQDNWLFEDCFVVGQGTTSNNYRDAGKNLEIICCFDGKYKNKKILKEVYSGDEEAYYKHRTKLTLNPRDDDPKNRIDNSYDATIENSPGNGKVALHKDAYPNNYYNIKVNIASSENANNALQANRYDRFLPYVTPAKKRDPRIKTTMDFVNCVVFLCETDPSGIEFPPSQVITQPADSDYHFYAIGNIGDSKKTDADRAYDPDDEKEFVVEILDNDKPNAAFPTGIRKDSDNTEFQYPISREDWEAVDGYRLVDSIYLIDENLPNFYELKDGSYVKTEDETIVSNKDYYEVNYLNSAYESLYVDKFRMVEGEAVQVSGWASSYEMRYGEDTEENINIWNTFYEWLIMSSNTDFKNQFSNWFIQDAALYYYLFTERYTMMDNRAKNSFWHWAKFYITEEEAQEMGEKAKYYTVDNTAASINKGYRFDFWDYDNDTALGIDNNGQIKFAYGLEDIDKNEDGTFVFNAGNSVFFRRIRESFQSELATVCRKTSAAWDAESLIKEYDAWQDEFGEALYLEDTERKYYRPYRNKIFGILSLTQGWLTDHLTKRMQGRKKYHRRQWDRDQGDYMNGKYVTEQAANKKLLLRCKTPPNPVVPADYTWKLKPYKKGYLRVYLGDALFDSVRALDLTKTYNLIGSHGEVQDAQLEVRNAHCIRDFGDLSTFYAYSVEPGAGTERVESFVVGNPTEGYRNDALNNISIGTANILKTLNVQNLRNVTSLSLVPSLEYLYAQNSGLTNATFPKGGFIKEAYLPATINTLKAEDLYYLNTLELDSYDNLKVLLIDNCPQLTQQKLDFEIINKATNLERFKITNVDWTFANGEVLNRLLKLGGFAEDNSTPSEQSVLTGKVHLEYIRAAELAAYNEAWPELIVTSDNEIPQYTVSFTNNGETVYSMLVDEGITLNDSHDPVKNGTIPTPTIPDSADGKLTYVFKEWKTADGKQFNGYTITNTDVTFQTVYDENIKYYKVKWYKTSTFEAEDLLEIAEVPWGGNAEYSKELPTRPVGGNTYFLFEKWSDPSTNITKDTNIYAMWTSSNPNTLGGIDTKDLTATDIYALKQIGSLTGGLDPKFTTPGDTLTLQLGYMPSYENMTEQILIDSPRTFNGTSDYYNTGINLFQEDQSFTLAIDFEAQPDENSVAGSLVSCYYISRNGFKLDSGTHSKVPTLYYKSASSTIPVGHMTPTKEEVMVGKDTSNTWRTHREICVIRKIKGDNTLYVYTNNRYGFNTPIERHDIPSTVNTFASIKNSLSFGAALNESGSASDFGKGIIHYAKLWNGDIGDDECRKVCSWIYTTMECEYVGKGLYNYENSDVAVQGTFIAKNLLDEKMYMNNASSNTDKAFDSRGYGPSDLRRWLQEKPFAGLSYAWKQTLSKSQVFSLEGAAKDTQNIVDTGNLYMEENAEGILVPPSDYFFLPSAVEMDSQYAYKSNDNEIYLSESTNSFPIFTNNQDRIKRLANSDIEYGYWLRSPKQGQYSLGRFLGIAPTSQNNYGGQVQPQYQVESYYNFNGWRSSKHDFGVLLTFSI